MCVGRGDKWLLEKRATDGAVCPPGGKIESRQSMYELERNAVGTQVTVYTETALQAVIRESQRATALPDLVPVPVQLYLLLQIIQPTGLYRY